jgi:hypothetical protein
LGLSWRDDRLKDGSPVAIEILALAKTLVAIDICQILSLRRASEGELLVVVRLEISTTESGCFQ